MGELILNKNGVRSIQVPNKLIFAPQKLSKLEKRILYLCINELKKKQETNTQFELFQEEINVVIIDGIEIDLSWDLERTVRIPFKEVKKYGDWKQFKKSLKVFKNWELEIEYYDNKQNLRSREIRITDQSEAIENNGIMIQFSKTGLSLLTQLSKSYTKIPLEIVLQLNSKYSQRLYELFISKCYGSDVGFWKVDLDDFRKLLGIEEDSSYFHWGSLERATLLNFQKELIAINKILKPLSFTYKPIKSGNKVVKLDIEIYVKRDSETAAINKLYSEKQNRAIRILEEISVREDLRSVIAESHLDEFYKWNYNRNLSKIPYNNPAGHLLKTLGLV